MAALTSTRSDSRMRDGTADRAWHVPTFVQRSLGRWDQRVVTRVIAVAAAALAFVMRWTQDDSYISLRYARNLVEGHGLVYNPGEQVEGYTNFLWTLIMAVPLRLGIGPVGFMHVVGIASMVGTILVTARLASRVFASPVLGNLTALVMVANFTFLAYGTGGLETPLQALLVTSVWLVALPALGIGERQLRTRELCLLSTLCGLALLTRLDSAVVVLVPAAAVLRQALRDRVVRRVAGLVALFGPVLVLVVPWTVWRVATYGSVVPNTATAKSTPLFTGVLQGASFLAAFVVINVLFVFIPPLLLRGRELLGAPPFPAVALTLGLWVTYLMKVGGDFMEFRFMVAVLPLTSLGLVALVALTRRAGRQRLLLRAVAAGFFVHFMVMSALGGAANVEFHGNLHAYVTSRGSGFELLGEELREVLHGSRRAELPGSDSAVLAFGAAGATVYTARLRNVDPFGLTDEWTASNGLRLDSELIPKQGHTRYATFAHLVDREVTLLIGPRSADVPERFSVEDLATVWFDHVEPDVEHLPAEASVVEIPMPDGSAYLCIYLRRHPDVDAAIASGRWRQRPIERDPRA